MCTTAPLHSSSRFPAALRRWTSMALLAPSNNPPLLFLVASARSRLSVTFRVLTPTPRLPLLPTADIHIRIFTAFSTSTSSSSTLFLPRCASADLCFVELLFLRRINWPKEGAVELCRAPTGLEVTIKMEALKHNLGFRIPTQHSGCNIHARHR